jgi:hypothetical protein
MWVLEPVAASSEQQTFWLTSGDISIGRPLKKGSTVGKADILIFNEQSVSSIHATLRVEAATQQQEDSDDGFIDGSICITGGLRAASGDVHVLPLSSLRYSATADAADAATAYTAPHASTCLPYCWCMWLMVSFAWGVPARLSTVISEEQLLHTRV